MEAQQNLDVKTNLLPIAIEATRAMNVVFPHDKESDVSAHTEHTQLSVCYVTLSHCTDGYYCPTEGNGVESEDTTARNEMVYQYEEDFTRLRNCGKGCNSESGRSDKVNIVSQEE